MPLPPRIRAESTDLSGYSFKHLFRLLRRCTATIQTFLPHELRYSQPAGIVGSRSIVIAPTKDADSPRPHRNSTHGSRRFRTLAPPAMSTNDTDGTFRKNDSEVFGFWISGFTPRHVAARTAQTSPETSGCPRLVTFSNLELGREMHAALWKW